MRETKRCREIVRGLLDFARQTPPRRQPTDLNDVARRARGGGDEPAAAQPRRARRSTSADDLPPVDADPNQIQQVVVNLLLNAADAVGERGGTIRLSSRRAELPPRGHEPIRRAACPKRLRPARSRHARRRPARDPRAARAPRPRVGVPPRSGLRPLQPRRRPSRATRASSPRPRARAAASALVEPDAACERCGGADVRRARPRRRADPLVHAHGLPLHARGRRASAAARRRWSR